MSKHREKFSTQEEWNLFIRLGKAKQTQEERQEFFVEVMTKKHANPKYSLFSDYPGERATGLRICSEIIAQVKAINEKAKSEEPTFLPKRDSGIAEWGEQFGQHIEAELKRQAEEEAKRKAEGESA